MKKFALSTEVVRLKAIIDYPIQAIYSVALMNQPTRNRQYLLFINNIKFLDYFKFMIVSINVSSLVRVHNIEINLTCQSSSNYSCMLALFFFHQLSSLYDVILFTTSVYVIPIISGLISLSSLHSLEEVKPSSLIFAQTSRFSTHQILSQQA